MARLRPRRRRGVLGQSRPSTQTTRSKAASPSWSLPQCRTPAIHIDANIPAGGAGQPHPSRSITRPPAARSSVHSMGAETAPVPKSAPGSYRAAAAVCRQASARRTPSAVASQGLLQSAKTRAAIPIHYHNLRHPCAAQGIHRRRSSARRICRCHRPKNQRPSAKIDHGLRPGLQGAQIWMRQIRTHLQIPRPAAANANKFAARTEITTAQGLVDSSTVAARDIASWHGQPSAKTPASTGAEPTSATTAPRAPNRSEIAATALSSPAPY